MKFMSIKLKITLWYTIFMVGLVGGILGVLVEFTDMTLLTNQKNQLVEAVEDAVKDIKKGDDFDNFDDGVYILVYSENGEYLRGSVPFSFPIDYQLKSGQVQELKGENGGFYIYDREIKIEKGRKVWIRGVFSDVQTNQLTEIIVKGAFFVLPFLVILSAGVGYFITKRAFLPVKKIQETAENITRKNELSIRIGLTKGKDEISKLANTIDEMLEKLDRSFQKEKQFTSDASHELRTPITVILAESEYILSHGEDIVEAKESMEIINRQAEKISALINQLLFFSRADRDDFKLKLEKISVSKLLEELKEDNSIEAEKKNITISYRDNLKNKEYFIDRILFIRVVQNVLQNAIVYGKENGKIEIESLEVESYFVVKIKDNGIGIARENISKIWDRFYQVEESRTTKSMGLGLSMVKFIVEKHKGMIEVESELGLGSTFTMYFNKFLN